MASHDPVPESARGAENGPDRAEAVPPPAPGMAGAPSSPGRALVVAALAAGVVAGFVSWQVGERAYRAFLPQIVRPPNYDQMGTYEKRDFDAEAELDARPAAELKNAAVAFGALGAALGAALGLAAGLSRRAFPSALASGAAGLVVGGVAGVAGAAAFVPVFFRFYDPESGMMLSLGVHCGLWAITGAGAGLALGMGLAHRRLVPRAVIGGLFGGLAGAVMFELINAVAFPLVRVEETIPADRYARLAAHLCVAIGVAAFAAIAATSGKAATRNAEMPPGVA